MKTLRHNTQMQIYANLADFYRFLPTLMNYASASFHCKGFPHIFVESPGSILTYSKLLFGSLM